MITKEKANDLLEYKDGNLYWKNHKYKKLNGKKAGTLVKSSGYYMVRCFGKAYLNHRLIFLMHHNYLPEIIDHIDGNQLNNKIENLRPSTPSTNQYNSKKPITNTSGIKGVHFDKNQKKWMVKLRINGIQKFFGYFKDLELAGLVAQEARQKYHKEFAKNE